MSSVLFVLLSVLVSFGIGTTHLHAMDNGGGPFAAIATPAPSDNGGGPFVNASDNGGGPFAP
jgi:hypothetical protein